MKLSEFQIALERRGFRAVMWIPEHDKIQAIVHLGDRSMPWTIALSALQPIEMSDVGSFIAREFAAITSSMHFVCCAQCQEPLLRGVGGSGKGEGSTHWYEFRSAKAGPDSPVLTNCSVCGITLDTGMVQEIVDN